MALDPRAILYSKEMSPLEFNYETLFAPSIYQWLSYDDIYQLYRIINSVKLSSNIQEKKRLIDQIMTRRGCHKIGGGTNRIVYAPYECTINCFKIALDPIGIRANQSEYHNQNYLKPFVCKMFEIDQTGIIGNYERVKAIQSREEYESVASDIFELLTNNILGKYVMEDIGTNYMFNYGVRVGFGVVLIDYAMLFELDGSKLYCNNFVNGIECGGEIDYDDGFNHLYCTKCGLHYQARKLSSSIKQNKIKIMKEENDMSLISQLIINGEVVLESGGSTETVKQDECKGMIVTRNRKMTPKEAKRYNQEQRKKQKHNQNNQQDNSTPIAVIEDVSTQTIGDIVGEALSDIIKQENIPSNFNNVETKTDYKTTESSNNGTVADYKTDENKTFSAEELQASLTEKDYTEPDYSKYGLEPSDESDVVEQEDIEQSYDDSKYDSMKNFTPIKNKKNKLENL